MQNVRSHTVSRNALAYPALELWRAELARGYGGQHADRPATWRYDALWRAVSWIVDGILPAGGLSVFVAKPKAGKSTTARAIALRVSRGEPVLGRATAAGPVIYLGLEDHRRVTKGHFRTLGAHEGDDLYVWTGARPGEAMIWLERTLAGVDPVLVVVDTMQHLLGMVNLNDYAEVVTKLGPVLNLVRPRQSHLMLVHHAGKGDRTGFDAILGSTAIPGTVDTA